MKITESITYKTPSAASHNLFTLLQFTNKASWVKFFGNKSLFPKTFKPNRNKSSLDTHTHTKKTLE